MASGLIGLGRMSEPVEILGQVRWLLSRGGPLDGRRVLVTAGGTQEPIDPVRTITNRSSGRQGYAMAQAALDLGAQVTLIHAPTHLPLPTGAEEVSVCTAAEMQTAIETAIDRSDALIMAAAVADFRPSAPAQQKIKKENGLPEISIESTPDILSSLAHNRAKSGKPQVMVGFAAESQDLLANANRKLAAKHLDMIVANDITASDAGFAVDTNRVSLLYPDGKAEDLPLMSKAEVAETIMQRVAQLLGPISSPESQSIKKIN
jgi:phosphopantothenoylcysteine decarboxylase/phosphopantothenate--cysteine ligase